MKQQKSKIFEYKNQRFYTKAQVGQVFIFILAIVIAAMVLLLGYNFVRNWMERQDQILLTDFINDITNTVATTDFGSLDLEEYRVPSDYNELCFVDYRITVQQLPPDFQADYPLIYGEIEARGGIVAREQQNNMFLINEKDNTIYSESIGKVVETNNYFCTDIAGGKVNLRFEGIREGTEITTWQ